jgi:hypothetical protein
MDIEFSATTMTTLETIINELSSAPESLLLKVVSFIRSAKDNATLSDNLPSLPRIPNLHQGEIWMSDDFNDPLPWPLESCDSVLCI